MNAAMMRYAKIPLDLTHAPERVYRFAKTLVDRTLAPERVYRCAKIPLNRTPASARIVHLHLNCPISCNALLLFVKLAKIGHSFIHPERYM